MSYQNTKNEELDFDAVGLGSKLLSSD